MSRLLNSNIIFWIGWVILPIILSFIPAVHNFILLVLKKSSLERKYEKFGDLKYLQPISIIVPVYNSEATLYNCIKSINDSNYDLSLIDVLCVDNGSKDNSFDIFSRCKLEFQDLNINWLRSANGKSRAMNMAIYNSEGKYIINIDSDGILEKNALRSIVYKFEVFKDIDCMTGAILIEPRLIELTDKKKHPILYVFRKLEFLEYAQAFLAGRNFQAETKSLFTLSGAFSAFRKSTLFKTRMYNVETVGEDTNLTFQVKDLLNDNVSFCEEAIFMVDPIENINKYYTQRQRWQLGELEVANQFILKKMKNPLKIFLKYDTRLLIFDHTMAFPKLIWLAVLFILSTSNGAYGIVFFTTLLMYAIDLASCYIYAINIITYLNKFREIRKYYIRNLGYMIFMPMYSLFGYFVRMCGILNSMTRKATWKTKNFTQEFGDFKDEVNRTLTPITKFRNKVQSILEEKEG